MYGILLRKTRNVINVWSFAIAKRECDQCMEFYPQGKTGNTINVWSFALAKLRNEINVWSFTRRVKLGIRLMYGVLR